MPDTDLLTPTSKLKRRGVLADEIDALYVVGASWTLALVHIPSVGNFGRRAGVEPS
jgi:hypothetical protein